MIYINVDTAMGMANEFFLPWSSPKEKTFVCCSLHWVGSRHRHALDRHVENHGT